ncbi:MAG: helix-turn-helix transcriptional regulator [Ruminococcaceae bacterium]|nr:helix-turn-helix transcriptional regulator [Oscillospiraceae bacterium]
MLDCSIYLGNAVKKARGKMHLTQSEVAAKIDVDVRTVLNIENNKGNPKLEVLFPLVRALNMDTQEIFYPEMFRESISLVKLQQLVGECSDEEAEALIPIVSSVISALRSKESQEIE